MSRSAPLILALATLVAMAGAWLWLRKDPATSRRAGGSSGDAADAAAAGPHLEGTAAPPASTVAGDQPPASPAEVATPLRGVVLDAVTGAAIRDASLVVVETDDWCFEAEAGEAAFTAPAIPPGPYELAIFAEGFLPARASRIVLNASDDPVTVRLTLDRGASVAGTVRDEQGRAVPGVDVGVAGDEGVSAATDKTGAFTLGGLADGPRTLVLTSPRLTGAVQKVLPVDRAFVAKVDCVVSMAGALAVQCDGAPWGNDLRLLLRDVSDAAVSSASKQYFLSPSSGPSGRWGPSEIHTFESLAPATYSLLVTWNGEPEPPIPVQVRLGETTQVTITPP